MTDTTAKILAKGLESTGVTEELANELFRNVGRHFMAIVELEVVYPHGPNTEGKRRIDLRLTQVEPAIDDNLDDHLRNLTRVLHYNRQVEKEGPTLDGGEERTVDDVLSSGRKHEPHPYLASTLSVDDNAVCDVCGQHEGAAVHADRTALDDPFTINEEISEEDLDQADEEDEVDDGADVWADDPTYDAGDTDDDPAYDEEDEPMPA